MTQFQQECSWQSAGQDVRQPLLPREGTATVPPSIDQQHSRRPAAYHSSKAQHTAVPQQRPRTAAVDLGGRFLRRLFHLMGIVQAAPALILVLISLAETVIVSKVGTISGLFYQVFVDGQASQVAQLMLWSAGCYTATALFYSFKAGLQDFFAWRWRASLTLHLQGLYCRNIGAICPKSQEPLLQSLDSPDQRVAQDLPLLTASLSEVLTQLAAVPFNIIWYTHLTYQVFGSWLPVLSAFLFFLVGLVLQRLVMLPVASAVFQQEAAEGAFRYGHTRFRAWAAEIAMYRSEPLEQQHLEGQLARVLVCQGRLLLRRAVVTATSRLLEYGGLVVNFGCLAFAVFHGAWSGPGQSAGDIASKVSVASFYLLTLIYNFSQVLDLASKVANLAGLTARVSEMLEVLRDPLGAAATPHDTTHPQHAQPHHHPQQQHLDGSGSTRPSKSNKKQATTPESQGRSQLYQQQQVGQQSQQQQQPLQQVAAGKSPSHQRYASQAVLLQEPQLVLVPAALDSTTTQLNGSAAAAASAGAGARRSLDLLQQPLLPQQHQAVVSTADDSISHQPARMSHPEVMQVSIHSMGADMLLQEARRAFPDSPRLAPLLAVVTFQFCGAAKARMLQKLHQQHHQHHQQQQVQLVHNQRRQQEQQQGDQEGRGVDQQGSSCCSSCASGSTACAGAAGSPGLCADVDMQQMLSVFLSWQQAVYDHITSRGYWCDTIDPRSGTALHSTPGSHYDEVIGASVLLGYEQVTPPGQTFSLISHPEAATQVYPATLFTSAPLPVVREALRAAAAVDSTAAATAAATSCPEVPSEGSSLAAAAGSSVKPSLLLGAASTAVTTSELQQSLPGGAISSHSSDMTYSAQSLQYQQHQQQLLLLSCSQLSVSTPSGVPIVRGLSLQVLVGQSVLIQGPSGCGKSTLISCLAGLWPAGAGRVCLLPNGTAGLITAAGCCDDRESDSSVGASQHWNAQSSMSSTGPVGAGECLIQVHMAAGRAVLPLPAAAPAVLVQALPLGLAGVLFVPQRALAAPGTSLRQQLLYPAAGHLWPCTCPYSIAGAMLQQSLNKAASTGFQRLWEQQQWQQAVQRKAAGPRSWWIHWLSCGLYKQLYPAAVAAPTAGCKQQQQQLPLLPQHQPAVCSSCQHLLSVLDSVGLSYLLAACPNGLHTVCEAWVDVLSPGELQRLTFARVLLHRPALVIFDEATSALPDEAAVELYRQLQAVGISFVSVGHSSCLTGVHDRVLSIVGDGSGDWQLG